MRIILLLILSLTSLSVSANERPSLEIEVKDHFVCRNGESLNGKLYQAFCEERGSIDKTLYILFDPSEKILFRKEFLKSEPVALGSVSSWCNNFLVGQHGNAGCILIAENKRSGNKIALNALTYIHSNLVSVNITSLKKDEKYHIYLQEISSESLTTPFLFKN